MATLGERSTSRPAFAGAVGLAVVLALGSLEARAQERVQADREDGSEPEEAVESVEAGKAEESPLAADVPPDDESYEARLKLAFEGDGFDAGLAISGTMNRAFLIWDDGGEGDAYFVDNAQDGTAVEVEGNVDFDSGWRIGVAFGVDILVAPSDEVNQFDASGFDNRVEVSDLYASIGHERLGTVVVGYADTASDDIDNMNLAESDALADADVSNWNAGFLIRPSGEGLSELPWEDFVDGTFAGDTRRIVGYTSPELRGFEGSAAVSADYWDVALRYSGEWADTFQFESGIGHWQDTRGDGSEPVDDVGWGGSVAVKHLPTGLNIAFNAGRVAHADDCEEPGEASGECPGSDRFTYVKGGIVRDFTAWGATSLYGEFYRERKQQNDSDPDVLAELEQVAGAATELKDSRATVWGIGVAQEIDAWNAEIYLGYRRYHLDVDLAGPAGAVADKGIDDFHAVMAGAAFRF